MFESSNIQVISDYGSVDCFFSGQCIFFLLYVCHNSWLKAGYLV